MDLRLVGAVTKVVGRILPLLLVGCGELEESKNDVHFLLAAVIEVDGETHSIEGVLGCDYNKGNPLSSAPGQGRGYRPKGYTTIGKKLPSGEAIIVRPSNFARLCSPIYGVIGDKLGQAEDESGRRVLEAFPELYLMNDATDPTKVDQYLDNDASTRIHLVSLEAQPSSHLEPTDLSETIPWFRTWSDLPRTLVFQGRFASVLPKSEWSNNQRAADALSEIEEAGFLEGEALSAVADISHPYTYSVSGSWDGKNVDIPSVTTAECGMNCIRYTREEATKEGNSYSAFPLRSKSSVSIDQKVIVEVENKMVSYREMYDPKTGLIVTVKERDLIYRMFNTDAEEGF